MKNLPQIIWYSFWTGMLIFIISCAQDDSRENARNRQNEKESGPATVETTVEKPPRIRTVTDCGFCSYRIINVDGHEYLSYDQGGIIHLESCPCKTRHEPDTTGTTTSNQ
jgi:hypothetical protein